MSTEPLGEPQQIAGFWRRLLAFFLDCMLLGAIGVVIGSLFLQQLVELGPWGRLLGFVVAIVYFGVFNSKLGKGQTPGKRVLKIKVVARDGALLSVPKAFLRFIPLGAPWFLNNAQFPESVFQSPLINLLSVVVFGIGLSVIYLYVFNRRSRQSLHDLLVGSCVVSSQAQGPVPVAEPGRIHLMVCVLLLLASAIVPYFVKRLETSEPFVSLTKVQRAALTEPWVEHVQVSQGKTLVIPYTGDRKESTYLNVTAYVSDPDIGNAERAARLAELALAADRSAMGLDLVRVTLAYGFDIGIASSWRSHGFAKSPAEWTAR